MNLSDLIIVVRASTKDFEAGMARTRKEIASTQTTAQRMNNVGGTMVGVGKKMAMGITLPVVAAAAISVKLAADFEQNMNVLEASLGGPAKVSKTAMGDLSKFALKMGADTVFSAGEAGLAMVELAKGGMNAAQIKAGGLKAALDLAAAGDLDLATASATTVNAMNMFGLKATDATSIAAALAGGANASTASVESLALGLSQVGPGAVNAGLSLQETVGVLSAFENAGIKGSDAGTSLKTMLTRLVPTTNKSAKMMKSLGLDFTDSAGNIDDVATVAEKLKTKLGPLSQEQRTLALNTMFGSDASRAAAVLMKEGGAGIDKYVTATSNQNAATDMAAARMKGLKGMLEQLKGSLETIAIVIGTTLIPPLTAFVKWLTKIFNKFLDLDKGTQKTILVLALVAAAIGPLLILFGKMAQGMSAIINVSKAFGKMPGGFGKFAKGLKTMLGGDLESGKTGLAAKLKSAVTKAVASIKSVDFKALGKGVTTKLQTALGAALSGMKSVGAKGADAFKKYGSAAVDAVAKGLKAGGGKLKTALQAAASGAGKGLTFAGGVIASGASVVKDTAATVANSAARLANAIATKVVTAAQWLWNVALTANPIGLIVVGIVALVAVFVVLWTKCKWFRDFWKGLWNAIKPSVMGIVKGLKVAWDAIVKVAKAVWAKIGPAVIWYVKSLWTGLKFWFGVIKKVLHAAWTGLVAVTKKVWPLVVAVVRGAMTNIRVAVAVIRVVVNIVRGVWRAVAAVTRTVWHAVAFVVRQGINRVVQVVHLINRARNLIRQAWNKVKEVTSTVWEAIKGVVGRAVEWIMSKIRGVVDAAKGIAKSIGGLFGGGSNDGARVGKGGRRFASGGYVPATMGGRSITVGEGGEGEWVVPASKRRAFAEATVGKGGGGGDTFNINIANLHGTDEKAARDFAAKVGRHLMTGVRRNMVGQNA